ncbi:MAG: ABC transporter substrate-binding protein [Bacillota bacterium]
MRPYLTAGLILCLAVTLWSISTRAVVREPDEDSPEQLVMAVPLEVRDIFPLSTTDPVTRLATHLVHQPLATYGSTGELEPVLAQSWHTDDGGNTWIIHLRPNVYWHDETPFTAADVAFTYRLAVEEGELPFPLADLFDNLIDVTCAHDHQVKLHLRRPEGSPPALITIPLVAQHWVESRGTRVYNRHPMGTGPYTLKQWSPHTAAIFTAQDDYWGNAPLLDAIELAPLNDPELRTRAVLSGFAHCALDPEPAARGAPLPSTDVVYLAMPSAPPFLAYRAARRAIETTLSQKMHELAAPPGIPATGPWPPASPLHRPEEEVPAGENPEDLLDGAGWTDRGSDGVRMSGDHRAEFTLMVPNWRDFPQLANWIARTLAEIGVSVVIETAPLIEVDRRLTVGDYEAALVQVTVGPDPDLSHLLSSSAIGARYNDAKYESPSVDLLLRSLLESSPVDRGTVAQEILKILSQDIPAAWLYYPQTEVLVGDRVRDLEWIPGPLLSRPELIRVRAP